MNPGEKISVIVTGATGMVGEGVLHECLQHPAIDKVLIVVRRPSGTLHPKAREIILNDLSRPEIIKNELDGFHACFFCMGVSSIRMKEQEYSKLTYDLTMGFARTLQEINPALTFCYISGSGTDSSEKGRSMWARVKGRTENELLRLFPNSYMFRPGYMQPTPGLKRSLKMYKYVGWMYPAMRAMFPSFVGSLKELGLAMIAVTQSGYEKRILEVKDIKKIAEPMISRR